MALQVPITQPVDEPRNIGGLVWFSLHFPRDLDLRAVTSIVRPLAHRPTVGLLGRTPLVIFELRVVKAEMNWLLGMEPSLSSSLPNQLRAQLPHLVLIPQLAPPRPAPFLATDLHVIGLSQLLRLDMASGVSAALHNVLRMLQPEESAVLQWVVGPVQQRKIKPEPVSISRLLGFGRPPGRRPYEQQQWKLKVAEPLFAVHGHVGASTGQLERTNAVVQMLAQAVTLANASHTEIWSSRPTRRGGRAVTAVPRTGRWFGILNAAELAAVLGAPLGDIDQRVHRAGPAPHSLLAPVTQRSRTSSTRVLGHSVHPSDRGQFVTMPVAAALHHVHVTGVTGSGKSTQLASFVRSDMFAGRSVLLIEPRGDLVEDVLQAVPASRREDVVLIEPGVSEQVVGINPLAGAREDAERRADQVMHLFRSVFGTAIGPRSGDVLLHALVALARSPQGTLTDLPMLLTNSSFRRRVLHDVTDPLVLGPFFAWYDGLSDGERAQVIAPVLNKTRVFLSRPAIRRLLGQADPQFDLDDLFTKRRIVLVSLNTGLIGTETAALIGALLMTQLWQAIQRRAAVPAAERLPVMAVIDEIQDYLKLPVDVGDFLAQARALGVSLTAAHQHLGQLTPGLRAAFFANARSRMAFHPSADDAPALAQVLGGDVTAADLDRLGRFEAYCRVMLTGTMTAPFIVRTRPPARPLSDPTALREASQARYGVDARQLDAALTARWQGTHDQPDGPIGIGPRKVA